MGREIRMVPPDWEHPKYLDERVQYGHQKDAYHPFHDQDYESAAKEWMRGLDAWRKKKRKPSYAKYYWEYAGNPPDEEYYRTRKWTKKEATYYQVYETVSEGTPVTPQFATKEELIEYLVANGDFWDQKRGEGGWSRESASKFVGIGWAPSLMVIRSPEGNQIKQPRDGI